MTATTTRKRRRGDRYDGRLIRTLDPLTMMVPFIMRTRGDAQNFFEDRVEISHAERWLREQRDKGIGDIGILHVIMAACVRAFALRPRVNRFVKNGRIYARNDLTVSLAIKKTIDEDGIETTLKLHFDRADTIWDVRDKLNAAVSENKKIEAANSTDKLAGFFVRMPPFFLKGLVSFLWFLDDHGWLPKAIHAASPFHTSLFITDLGSVGIQSIYHHLYEFGTTSLFLAFGSKSHEKELVEDGSVRTRKHLTLRVNTDERIVDGFYYASAFRLLKRLVTHPELLEAAPESIPEDID
ncbi:MAG: hypothetical protein JXA15_07010 [Spirochaetales bacterium]|nr:hypothetical protein [Spirochaetales bacterium]